jgi:hypothetical protein
MFDKEVADTRHLHEKRFLTQENAGRVDEE